MALVDTGELDLPQRPLALGPVGGSALGRTRAFADLLGPDPLRLEHVDPLEQPGQQPARIAADLVPAQRQLVEALEQGGETVGRAGDLEERVATGLERVVA